MQRPTRILVIGLLCLLTGGLTGLKNGTEAMLALIGADGLEQMVSMMEGMNQPISESQREDLDLQIRTYQQPVYRFGQLIESVCTTVMSVVIIVAGFGLLRDRAWALRLTRWWSYYTIPAAGVSVVLTMRYVVPEMPDMPTGGGMVQGAFMLLFLWTLPVLLLKVLPTPEVKEYLAARETQRTGSTVPHVVYNVAGQTPSPSAPPAPPTVQTPPPAAPRPPQAPPAPRPADTTWRDDPWNDPNSR